MDCTREIDYHPAVRLVRSIFNLGPAWWQTAVAAIGLVLILNLFNATQRFDNIIYDWSQGLGSRAPDDRILIVTIDNRSLAKIGKWPWPRSLHARLIDQLTAGRPRAILYDILFVEPADGDRDLSAAIAKSGKVYLPLLIGDDGPILPVRPLAAAAAGLGHVNVPRDGDGVVRRMNLVEWKNGRAFPHLIVRPALRTGEKAAQSLLEKDILIPYSGTSGTFRSISAAEVLDKQFSQELLRNRIVIVGATAQGLGDFHNIASGPQGLISGAELQANALDSLINGTVRSEAGAGGKLAFSLAAPLLLLCIIRILRARYTMPAVLLLAVSWIGTSILMLAACGLWLPPGQALAGIAFAYPFWAWRRLASVSRHMVQELEQLRTDGDLQSPFAPAQLPQDPLTRETLMLSSAVSELRSMRHFLAQTLDQLPDAVFVTDGGGNITLLNEKARLLPRPPDESSGSITSVLNSLSNSALAKERAWPPDEDDATLELASPQGRIYDVRIARYRNPFSHFEGWIIRLSDITTASLTRKQRDEMLDFLTHDMRAPQIAILSLTAADYGKKIDTGLAGKIDYYAQRTLQLADDIVHLARARMLRYEPTVHNLAGILVDAIEELWPQLSARHMRLVKEGTDTDEYLVQGEPTLLMRSLVNLIDNAIKYGTEGGIVRCSIYRVEASPVPEVHCSISDDGMGIAPDKISSIFERFQRGVPNVAQGGAGLGLSFVQTVVARHGGRISCSSRENGGTTFTIILPIVAQDYVETAD